MQVVIAYAERAIARERARDSASALEAEGRLIVGSGGAIAPPVIAERAILKTRGSKGSHEHCFFTNWARFRF